MELVDINSRKLHVGTSYIPTCKHTYLHSNKHTYLHSNKHTYLHSNIPTYGFFYSVQKTFDNIGWDADMISY